MKNGALRTTLILAVLSATINSTNVYLVGTSSHLETGTLSKCLGSISRQNTDLGLQQDLGRGDREVTINVNINKISNIFEGKSAVEKGKVGE